MENMLYITKMVYVMSFCLMTETISILYGNGRAGIKELTVINSHSQMFFKIDVLKNFAILTGKHLCWSLFLIKLQAFRSATLLNRDSSIGIILGILRNFQKQLFYRTPLVPAFVLSMSVLDRWVKSLRIFRMMGKFLDLKNEIETI